MQGTTFAQLGLSQSMINSLNKKGFEEPSPIQALVIPEFLKEQSNIIGQAQTGTGKTAAFAIPIIETLISKPNVTKALILAPTRELANQVSDEIYSLIGDKQLKVLPVYGGQSIDQQIRSIKRGIDIIVGTPGRVIDLLERKVLQLNELDFFVLDEADEMLNMGFIDAIEEILKKTNTTKKMLFFSATMPDSILKIAKKYMGQFKTLKVEKVDSTADLTEQIYFEVRESEKLDILCRVLDFEREFYGIIFARTKNDTDSITQHLKSRGYLADAIHGDVAQATRNKTLSNFKTKQITILVATDVAARGIDVTNLSHVINYSIPNEAESYVHRVGRTGRAGNKGIAITFVTPKELYQITRIQRMTKTEIKRQKAPSVLEVITAKKESLLACVNEVIKENDYNDYIEIANSLLVNNSEANMVIAAILRHVYGDEFLAQSYKAEREYHRDDSFNSRSNFNSEDHTKLFVALGKKDGMNPKKLLELIFEQAKTPARKIKDIRVLDSFSFLTVPFDEAEAIMQAINKERKGRPLITRAKK